MRLRACAFCAALLACFANPGASFAQIDIAIGYLEKKAPQPPILYNLDERPGDLGLAGGRLAIKDNATTGRFLKHDYELLERRAFT